MLFTLIQCKASNGCLTNTTLPLRSRLEFSQQLGTSFLHRTVEVPGTEAPLVYRDCRLSTLNGKKDSKTRLKLGFCSVQARE